MASSDLVLAGTSDKLEQTVVKLCTFCSNSTNGYDKWLYVTRQLEKPFFPVLGQIRGDDTVFDDIGRALVCIACFHHLLRQWSSYERRGVPLQKREYSLIGEEKLSSFQIKREDEIRKEAELKLKEIKLREEKIKKEAQERLDHYRRREKQIREEAEKRLLHEGEELEKIKREAERQLKEEKEYEEELKRSLEDEIRLEREKGEYIRKEAERLLREEILLGSQRPTPQVRTAVLIQSPQGRAYDQVTNNSHSNQDINTKSDDLDINMNPSMARSKKMEYDPETGCYRRIVPLDFDEQKVEDIVKTEMKKSEVKMKLRSDEPAWRRAEEKEHGSNPDTSLEDITLQARKDEADTTPHYLSGDSIQTEYKFTMKEEIQTESSPADEEKNGEFADEDIKKAGEAIKAKFDEDRMKFERDTSDVTMSEATKRSYERRRSQDDPDKKKAREDTRERSMSLEKKIKDMEERRARMLRRSSGEVQDDETTKITRTITTDTSSSKDDDNTGSTSKDESRSRRLRIREERTRRRLASEGLVSNPDDKATPIKSVGVKLELHGSGFGTKDDQSSFDSYTGHDDASDITFTVKKPADKQDDAEPDQEKVTSYTKTPKTVSLSGSLMDEPNVWSHTKTNDADDITFTVKDSTHKKDDEDIDDKPPHEDRVQEDEVKIAESEPVHSRFSGDFTQEAPEDNFTQEEPEDIVFTVKKTTTTENTQDEQPKFVKKEIVMEQRSFNPKTDLISWDEDNTDSGDKSIFKDVQPPKIHEQVVAESTNYKGSLTRAELSRDQDRRKKQEEMSADSTDGYRGSLGRSAIFHNIESDSHHEQPVEPQTETQVESSPPEASPVKEEFQAPVIVPLQQDRPTDDERRKRQLEIEEKQRQIMEKQQRASVKRRDKPVAETKSEDVAPTEQEPSEQGEDLKEKRRSLLIMWESYAEGEGPGPENRQDSDEKRRTSFGYEKMMMEATQPDTNGLTSAAVVDYRTMDVEEDNDEPRTRMIEIDEYHKLNDDELKWERAGQFQPGRLKSTFQDLGQDEPSADNIVFETKDTWKVLNDNVPGETTTNDDMDQRYSYQEPLDQSYVVESNEVESSPQHLWDESEDQSTHKDDDNEEVPRKPLVDVDALNRMTEDEARWERAGQFQPGKINTSIFEVKTNADQNERQGSLKFKKRETSKYDQIKKIQRTDSKKELLVPKKPALQASDNSDLMEQDEDERPEVGRLDKSSLIYETTSDEERQRREREERNRHEMVEIQREREQEQRRQEREDQEAATTINDFDDDEFDTKVKAKNIRQIDISKFGEFQKAPEPVQESRPVRKVSTKRYSSEIIDTQRIETVESAPPANEEDIFELKVSQKVVGKISIDSSQERDNSQPRKLQDRSAFTKTEDIVITEMPMEQSTPSMELENEKYNVRARSVKKLDKNRFPFSSDEKRASYYQRPKDDLKSFQINDVDETPVTDDRKVKREREMREWEDDLKREREQIEHVKEAHDKAFQANVEGGGYDIVANHFENQTRNTRKLDIKLFSKFEQEKPEPQAPVRKSSVKKEDPQAAVRKSSVKKEEPQAAVRKSSVKKEQKRTYSQEDIVTTQTVKHVESAPVEISPEEQYELKRRSIGKLNKDWMSQVQEQEIRDVEKRRKDAEMQKLKQEQDELDNLRMEDSKRKQSEGEVFGNVINDTPQNIRKLDTNAMSPFQKAEKSPDGARGKAKKSKDEIRQERKLARKESRSKMQPDEILLVEETTEVQQSPLESFESSQQNVGKLDEIRYRQMFSEDMNDKDRRKKQLEEERVRRELEEMERQKDEEEKRSQIDMEDDLSNVPATDKPQNVKKLDLSQFSHFQQQTTEEVTIKRSVKKTADKPREEEKAEDNVRETETVQRSVVQEVHSAPRYDDDEIIIEEKPKKTKIGSLDFKRINKSFDSESEEKQRRLEELKQERIRRENKERELLLLEQQRHRELPPRKSEDYVVKTTTVEEVQSAPTNFEDEANSLEQSPKKSVRRLDVEKYMKSFNDEAEEKRKRLVEMEKERIRREKEERDILLLEQQRQRDLSPPRESQQFVAQETTVQEVHSAPTYFDEDENPAQQSEKKIVPGQLDIEKIRKSFNDEVEEKKIRLFKMEQERIRRENEEREILLLEQQRQRDLSPPRRTEDNVVKATTVQEVQSAPVYEEESRKKSIPGQLDVQKYMKSFSDEAEEKRMRLLEMEKERIRRENEEREILLFEQQRQRSDAASSRKDDVIREAAVEEVESAPIDFEVEVKSRKKSNDAPSTPTVPTSERMYKESAIEREREEQYSVEEKRKTPGLLNFNNIMQSFQNEEETKRRRLMELEHERRLRDDEEKEISRIERRKSSSASNAVNVSVAQEVQASPAEDILFEERKSSNKLDRERRESQNRDQNQVNHTEVGSSSTITYDDNPGSSQDKKGVGKLDLNKFSQAIDQETRERDRRSRQLEMERLRVEREEMESLDTNQSTNSDRMDDGDRTYEIQSDANDGDTDSNRSLPRKLDLSKFSAFSQGGLRVTKDDTAVKRRAILQPRQARPKSIAGTSFKGVANGNASGYGDTEYRIIN